jgi:hypothetical protein
MNYIRKSLAIIVMVGLIGTVSLKIEAVKEETIVTSATTFATITKALKSTPGFVFSKKGGAVISSAIVLIAVFRYFSKDPFAEETFNKEKMFNSSSDFFKEILHWIDDTIGHPKAKSSGSIKTDENGNKYENLKKTSYKGWGGWIHRYSEPTMKALTFPLIALGYYNNIIRSKFLLQNTHLLTTNDNGIAEIPGINLKLPNKVGNFTIL